MGLLDKAKAAARKNLKALGEAAKNAKAKTEKFAATTRQNIKKKREQAAEQAKEKEAQQKEYALKEATSLVESSKQILEEPTEALNKAKSALDRLRSAANQIVFYWETSINNCPDAYEKREAIKEQADQVVIELEGKVKDLFKIKEKFTNLYNELNQALVNDDTSNSKTLKKLNKNLNREIEKLNKVTIAVEKLIPETNQQTKVILHDLPYQVFRSLYNPYYKKFFGSLKQYFIKKKELDKNELTNLKTKAEEIFGNNSNESITDEENNSIIEQLANQSSKKYRGFIIILTELYRLYNAFQIVKKCHETLIIDKAIHLKEPTPEEKEGYSTEIENAIAITNLRIDKAKSLIEKLKAQKLKKSTRLHPDLNSATKQFDDAMEQFNKKYSLFDFVRLSKKTPMNHAPRVVVRSSSNAASAIESEPKPEEIAQKKLAEELEKEIQEIITQANVLFEALRLSEDSDKSEAIIKNYKVTRKKIQDLRQKVDHTFEKPSYANITASNSLEQKISKIDDQIKSINSQIRRLELHIKREKETAEKKSCLAELEKIKEEDLSFEDIAKRNELRHAMKGKQEENAPTMPDDPTISSTADEEVNFDTTIGSDSERSNTNIKLQPATSSTVHPKPKPAASKIKENTLSGSIPRTLKQDSNPIPPKPVKVVTTDSEAENSNSAPASEKKEETRLNNTFCTRLQQADLMPVKAIPTDPEATEQQPSDLFKQVEARLNTNYSKENKNHNRLFARPFKCFAKKRSKHKKLARLSENLANSLVGKNSEEQTQVLYGLLVLIILERSTEKLLFSSTLVGIASNLIQGQGETNKVRALIALQAHLEDRSNTLFCDSDKQWALGATKKWTTDIAINKSFELGLSKSGHSPSQ